MVLRDWGCKASYGSIANYFINFNDHINDHMAYLLKLRIRVQGFWFLNRIKSHPQNYLVRMVRFEYIHSTAAVFNTVFLFSYNSSMFWNVELKTKLFNSPNSVHFSSGPVFPRFCFHLQIKYIWFKYIPSTLKSLCIHTLVGGLEHRFILNAYGKTFELMSC